MNQEAAAGRDLEAASQLRQAAATLRAQGRLADAEAALRHLVAIAPDDAPAAAELALVLSLLGRPHDAEPVYRRALELDPRDVASLSNLAATLEQLGRPAEAEALARRVLEIAPDHAPTLRNLSLILKQSARFEEAVALARRAAATDPGLEAQLQAHLMLTPMVRSPADIDAQRSAYAAGLDRLAAMPGELGYAGEAANLPWCHLAYHGRDDRGLVSRTAEVLARKAPDIAHAPALRARPPAAGRRLRIGFCSEFLRSHTIGRLNEGFIRRLDRARFEVVLLHAPAAVRDPFRDVLDAAADRAVQLPREPAAQRALVAGLDLDVLFYPDIGMSAQTYFLANARLAPVQATSWGHPNTTGVPAIDYFVSADPIEPDGAEASYSERLIRLSRLPCCYPAPQPPPAATREDLGLPGKGALYGCPQTLFKFHPDFDGMLAQIARADPSGHIVLVAPHIAAWSEALRARWAASHPGLAERVTFLRRLTHEGFMAHLNLIDVLLDPPHFGSGNTLYEGLSLGAPIVTWPGRFMRGRIVAGAYAQIGLEQAPVAGSPEAYAELAVALGRDPDRRARLKVDIREGAWARLYDDDQAVREFETFLEAAAAAAAHGERLPSGWHPGSTGARP